MSDAQIFSRGYRDYTGVRTGVGGAIKSVAWHAARSVLGIGRPGRYKILPIAIIFFAYIPSIIYVGLAIILPSDDLIGSVAPPLSDAIGAVFFQVLLFASFVVPGVLVRDRRDGMLSMYLSSPLKRSTYVLAKSVAVLCVLLFVTIGPALLQLLGFTFAGAGPGEVETWIFAFLRVVVSGIFVAVALGSVGMAASSLTDRPMFASVGIILLYLISGVVANALTDADFGSYLRAVSLIDVATDSVRFIFGEPEASGRPPGWFSFMMGFVWSGLAASVVWLRYRKVVAIR